MASKSSTLPPPVFDIHTPTSSFTIIHSLTQETLTSLFDKLSRKTHTDYHGERVGPSWLKYEWNDTVWNLDDDSDYTIFVWRQQQTAESLPDSSQTFSPVLHLQKPGEPLPTPPAYLNPSFYLFRPSKALPHQPHTSHASPRARSSKSHTEKSRLDHNVPHSQSAESVPEHKRKFQQFHEENGVRTVIGSIGPVANVRMLLKSGYRHVYISRKFAIKHGFIPHDAAPGHYGYGGLVNIGKWPITVTPAPPPDASLDSHEVSSKMSKSKPTTLSVYLSEEQHFDVVLGRSFFERRQIQINSMDPTDVICLDTGEKLECELVILKDGRGEILTVT